MLKKLLTFFSLSSVALGMQAVAQAHSPNEGLPHFEKRGAATQFVVDGKPYLMLAGELHNSSSSSVEYMQPIWPRLSSMHLNTVLAPVAWETIEPEKGKFDFRCVDGLLQGARENNLKLVFLWFGAWKNTFSSYVPEWVKTDTNQFPRVETSDGRSTERITPLSNTARDADAHAFAQLMRHLREVDGDKHTVVMIQVENEVGVIPESRDHSAAANAQFAAQVPAALTNFLAQHRSTLHPEFRAAWEAAGAKTSGTWQEVFGKTPLTDDFFMAWYYASYIDHVAAAGKAEYRIPMYANAALIRPNYEPGQYNSGGPLSHSIDIWHAAAPSLDTLSPDIYFNEFAHWAGEYTSPGNPLFVPETRGGMPGSANALYAFGHLNAVGFSPFGIDDPNDAPIDLAGIANSPDKLDAGAIGHAYERLSHLTPLILEAQRTGAIYSGILEGEAQRSARLPIGDYIVNINRLGNPAQAGARVGAMFIQTAPNEYLVVGSGDAQVTFTSDKPGLPRVGVASIDEEYFHNSAWTPMRRLNGDESSQGQALRLFASDVSQGRIYRVRLYRYR